MAVSKNNIVTHGLSGMVGDMLVFRQRGGKTIVSTAPKHSDKEASKGQQQTRERFQQAIIYGKTAIQDAKTKVAYASGAKEGQTAFNVAVADFFNAPSIGEVDISKYHGAEGDTITVRVTDDFMVTGVHLKIENGDGSLVEEGNAALDSNGLDYIYTATTENKDLAGDKITITATDTPNNTTTGQTQL